MKLRNKKTGIVYKIYTNITFTVGNEVISYNSIEKLLKEWEDYKPVEPLIKDDKIRKAVRAWAEANEDIEIVVYDSKFRELQEVGCDRSITLWGLSKEREPQLLHKGVYTIVELCGEEE